MTDQAVETDGIDVPQQGQRAAPGQPRAARQPPLDGPFLGRARELRNLHADIELAGLDTLAGRKAARARMLLVAGRPGAGRTALAEEFVRQVTGAHGRYPDGVLRARLTEPDGSPVPTAEVARTLLDTLGMTAPPGAGEDELTGTLRDALAARRAVLLLDGATGAEQVEPLLPDTPDCLVVAVAQGPLTGIPDVRPCTLGGLDTDSAVRLLSRFTGSVRITCDPRSAEDLAEECGRMPAALLLAGGWLAARPRVAVADLTRRLRAVPPPADDLSPLARVFSFVYGDLPAPTARVLRLASLAPAGLADPQTASALAGCSVTVAHDALDALTALGLLRPVGTPVPQYAVPDCLMPLLRRRTEAQDRPAELQLARARMLERTVTLLQSCRAVTEPDGSPARRKHAELPASLRFPSRTAAGRWLANRQDALLAAVRAAVADGGLDTLARRLAAALARALTAHRGADAAAELYVIHHLVLRVAERRGLHREQAAALLNLADLDARTGRVRTARDRYRAALDAGQRAGDPHVTGRAMESLGGAYQELGDAQRAVDWFGRALAHRLARDERLAAARLHGRIAGAQAQDGRYPEALRSWRSAVAGYRKAGDLPGGASALCELARTQEQVGRYDDALRTGREAVEWALRARDERLQAAAHTRLASVFDRLGDPVAARLHRTAAGRMLGEEVHVDSPGDAPDGPRDAAGDLARGSRVRGSHGCTDGPGTDRDEDRSWREAVVAEPSVSTSVPEEAEPVAPRASGVREGVPEAPGLGGVPDEVDRRAVPEDTSGKGASVSGGDAEPAAWGAGPAGAVGSGRTAPDRPAHTPRPDTPDTPLTTYESHSSSAVR